MSCTFGSVSVVTQLLDEPPAPLNGQPTDRGSHARHWSAVPSNRSFEPKVPSTYQPTSYLSAQPQLASAQ